jgi:hypothetical protein
VRAAQRLPQRQYPHHTADTPASQPVDAVAEQRVVEFIQLIQQQLVFQQFLVEQFSVQQLPVGQFVFQQQRPVRRQFVVGWHAPGQRCAAGVTIQRGQPGCRQRRRDRLTLRRRPRPRGLPERGGTGA